MFCQYCGKEIQNNSTFCNHCGNKVVTKKIEKRNTNVKKFYWSFLSITLLTLLIFSIISLFLPWVKAKEVKSNEIASDYSVSKIKIISILQSTVDSHNNTFAWGSGGSYLAVDAEEGGIAFILLILSGLFLFKRKSWAYILSRISLIIPFYRILWLNSQDFDFEFGPIIFIISTLLYTFFCMHFINKIN
jgi:hypothetical protein